MYFKSFLVHVDFGILTISTEIFNWSTFPPIFLMEHREYYTLIVNSKVLTEQIIELVHNPNVLTEQIIDCWALKGHEKNELDWWTQSFLNFSKSWPATFTSTVWALAQVPHVWEYRYKNKLPLVHVCLERSDWLQSNIVWDLGIKTRKTFQKGIVLFTKCYFPTYM